ncbi:hypothetical protein METBISCDRAFT_30580 [Metschnikowia bicuspidata]|uniref:Ataxin-10 homolog n=1 Tax=Metschnikowia bicuspidata TaxID=27322 RepID=A0A4P9ZFB6_9ASCO|nr:hypothetical protein METBISCDRAFT_30580 [Metschnikowia bicuspidata]
MDIDSVNASLHQVHELLRSGGDSTAYTDLLAVLANIIAAAGNPTLRDALVASGAIEATLDALNSGFVPTEEVLHLRVSRGAVLVLRNLILSARSVDSNSILKALQWSLAHASPETPFFRFSVVSYAELLANCASRLGSEFKVDAALFSKTLFGPVTLHLALSDKSLADPVNVVVGYLAKTDIHANRELLPVVEQLICHENFHQWTSYIVENDTKRRFLEQAVLAATGREDWDNSQCLTMLNWALDILKCASPPAIDILNAKVWDTDQLEVLHLVLVRALDILADLSKFNCAQQFFLEYDVLDTIIPLFRAVYENTTVKTAKVVSGTQTKEFPVVSSLIVEIVAFTCNSSFEAQEKIRQLHGLELVLSSCVIDDNNPFLKERAILCLKFLLEKNKANQQFVADLEAKNVAYSSALEAAEYEVDLVEGRVQVKKRQK